MMIAKQKGLSPQKRELRSRTQKGSGIGVSLEDDRGFAAIGGALPFAEAAFLGYADRSGIIRMNEADGAGIGEAGVAPGEDGGNGFSSVAFAVHGGREDPAGFAKIFDGRDQFAVEIGQTDFTGEGGGRFFFEDPEAETEEGPVACIAEEFHPGFLFGERASPDEMGDRRVGPHGPAGGEIFQAMLTETEARGFDHGKIRR